MVKSNDKNNRYGPVQKVLLEGLGAGKRSIKTDTVRGSRCCKTLVVWSLRLRLPFAFILSRQLTGDCWCQRKVNLVAIVWSEMVVSFS